MINFKAEARRRAHATETARWAQVQENLPTWDGPFRLLDLPAELRVHIYHYLLPHDLVIGFARIWSTWMTKCYSTRPKSGASGSEGIRWKTRALKRGEDLGVGYGIDHDDSEPLATGDGISLFTVSRLVSSEARAILYGENTFKLDIDGVPHEPVSLSSPLIFGPLGLDHRLPLLRNLRSITIHVHNGMGHWVATRHRARLQHFVNIIKQHGDDSAQRSLLKNLRVVFGKPGWHRSILTRQMYALEALAELRGVEKVEILHVEAWFKECLELCIGGKGGDVHEIDWPLIMVKRKKGQSTTRKSVWVTTRKWYNPTLNWTEFAERNGIDTERIIPVPETYDAFSDEALAASLSDDL